MLFLEERMRTGRSHVGEVCCNRGEGLVLLCGEDEGKFPLMQAVGADLLMV